MVEDKAKKKKGKRSPLTPERIFRSAVKLCDKEGIEALSMRKLAATLRVEAMSLYNHVKNKDDILDGMVDLVFAEIDPPEIGGDWKNAMRKRAQSAHEVLMRHPWATMVLMSRINVGPFALRYVNATLGCLREAGFSYALADYAWNTLDAQIYGYTLQRLNFPFVPDEYADVAETFMPQIPMEEYPYLAGLSFEVMEGRHDGLQELSFGLEFILEGLAQLLPQD